MANMPITEIWHNLDILAKLNIKLTHHDQPQMAAILDLHAKIPHRPNPNAFSVP